MRIRKFCVGLSAHACPASVCALQLQVVLHLESRTRWMRMESMQAPKKVYRLSAFKHKAVKVQQQKQSGLASLAEQHNLNQGSRCRIYADPPLSSSWTMHKQRPCSSDRRRRDALRLLRIPPAASRSWCA